jgi:trk system potassium uptake protein TrkA
MYILLVGGGNVGYYLAKRLVEDNHTVALVEKNSSICAFIAQAFNILVINGDGCEQDVLKEAGVERADVVAALTGDDSNNLIISQIAKQIFNVSRTVAKVNDPGNARSFGSLGVDVPIDSTSIIAKIIEEEVSFEDFVTLMTFKRGKIALVRVDLESSSPSVGRAVKDLVLPANSVLVSVLRADNVIIPKGDTILQARDDIVALTPIENEQELIVALLGDVAQ